MSGHSFFKALACATALPAVISAVATLSQKPAYALSAPAITSSVTHVLAADSLATDPPTLLSRYQDYRFELVNGHSSTMMYFYASPSDIDSWEDDILGDAVLYAGDSIRINIADDRQSCLYDFRAIFEDGSESTRYEVNVCDLSRYTF